MADSYPVLREWTHLFCPISKFACLVRLSDRTCVVNERTRQFQRIYCILWHLEEVSLQTSDGYLCCVPELRHQRCTPANECVSLDSFKFIKKLGSGGECLSLQASRLSPDLLFQQSPCTTSAPIANTRRLGATSSSVFWLLARPASCAVFPAVASAAARGPGQAERRSRPPVASSASCAATQAGRLCGDRSLTAKLGPENSNMLFL